MAAILCKWFVVCSLWFVVNPLKVESPAKVEKHPFYISVTEVNQNAKDKILEVSCKMFTEDFELTINKDYKAQLDILAGKDKGSFDKFIPDYMNKHLSFLVDGKPVKMNYVGFEVDKESVFCYFQINDIASVKKIDAVNSILHDFNDGQINIMHVTVSGKRQSTKLDYPNTKASFNF